MNWHNKYRWCVQCRARFGGDGSGQANVNPSKTTGGATCLPSPEWVGPSGGRHCLNRVSEGTKGAWSKGRVQGDKVSEVSRGQVVLLRLQQIQAHFRQLMEKRKKKGIFPSFKGDSL